MSQKGVLTGQKSRRVLRNVAGRWAVYEPYSGDQQRRRAEYATLASLVQRGYVERRGKPRGYEYRRAR